MGPILEINLNERWADCAICGAETLWKWGLPVDNCGDLAPNDSDDWTGAVACCEACYNAHAQGLLTAENQDAWAKRMELERRAMTAAFREEE